MFIRARSPLVCALSALAFAGSSHGAILFSYQDPDALRREFTHTTPAAAGQSGTVAFDPAAILSLTIDASEEQAGSRIAVDANLYFIDAGVGPVTKVGSAFIADVVGRFEFRLAGSAGPGSGDDSGLILAGDFTDAALFTLFSSGSLAASKNADGGSLLLSAGPALFDVLLNQAGYTLPAGGFNPAGPSSASWSLASIPEPINDSTLVSFPPGADRFLPSFSADSSFLAQATVIPAPAPALLLLGAVGFCHRRRR